MCGSQAGLPPPPKNVKDILIDPIDFIGRIIFTKIGGVNRFISLHSLSIHVHHPLILTIPLAYMSVYACSIVCGRACEIRVFWGLTHNYEAMIMYMADS